MCIYIYIYIYCICINVYIYIYTYIYIYNISKVFIYQDTICILTMHSFIPQLFDEPLDGQEDQTGNIRPGIPTEPCDGALGIMGFCSEIIPFSGRTIQVSELLLVGSLDFFSFFHILGIVIPIDSYFSEWLQPPTSIMIYPDRLSLPNPSEQWLQNLGELIVRG